MINSIQDDTGAEITIEDDGTIYIGATDGPVGRGGAGRDQRDRQPAHARGRRAVPRHGGEDDHVRRVRLAAARQGRPAAHHADPQAARRQADREHRRRGARSATRSRSRSARSTTAASCRWSRSRSWSARRPARTSRGGGDSRGDRRSGDRDRDRDRGDRGDRDGGRTGTARTRHRTRGGHHEQMTGREPARRRRVSRTVLPGGPAGQSPNPCPPCARSRSASGWGSARATRTRPTPGATHYLEHLLFKGTRRRTALEISAAMDAVGGELNAFTAQGVHLLLRAGARRGPAAGRRHPVRHGDQLADRRRRTWTPSAA